MMYKRILVTGSSGVLGSAFQAVAEEYPDCEFFFSRSKDCDLTDPSATVEYLKALEPDAIIHLAAVSGGVVLSRQHPATLLRDNVMMTLNILEASRILQTKKVVLTLSSGMYPEDSPTPIKEEYIHAGPAHESNYSYAYAKRLMEPAISAYKTEFGLNVIGLVPNGIIGENDNFSYESSVMVASLIRRFYEDKDSGGKLIVWGDGSPLREYTYAKDLARIHMWCLENHDDTQILNIGSTELHSVKEIAYMIAGIMGVDKSRIEFDTTKPSGIHKRSTDNTRFVQLSSFRYTDFRVALENTIEWFSDNYGNPTAIRL